MAKCIAPFMIGCLISLTLGQIMVPLDSLQASSPKASSSRILYSFPSPRRTPPVYGNGKGGAKKGSCYETKLPLTALVPERPAQDQPDRWNVWGQTVAERPTLWFYVPYALKDDMPVDFLLLDSTGAPVYQTSIQLPEAPGIIKVQLPASAPALQVDQFYQWSLDVKCDRPGMSVSGWIQRVKLTNSVEQRLATAKGWQKAALYAEHGIWFDALTVLAENHSGSLVTENWTDFLSQVGLGEIAQQPIAH